uniref:Polygalacturonase n=1 Tax=Oryza brachyantha TaxID=4533 RepID=J3ME71_ORYBR
MEFTTQAFVDAWSAACAVGSSTVVVPGGYRFVVGPVTFTGDSCQPNTVFQLLSFHSSEIESPLTYAMPIGPVDGTIMANTDSATWCSGNPVQQWLEFRGFTGLTIQGSGTIDGQGSHWWSGAAPATATDIDADRVGTNNRPTAVRVYQSRNVAVTGITIQNSARFHLTFDSCRAVEGGSGSVRGVRFSGVRVSAVRTPIVIDQYYCDHAACANQTAAVAVSGVAFSGVAGTYTQRPVYLACSDASPCAGLRLEDIQLAPVKKDGYGHLYGPFCWKAYGEEVSPVVPPVDCLMAGPP